MLNKEDIMPVIERAIVEDVGDGDITTKVDRAVDKAGEGKNYCESRWRDRGIGCGAMGV